MTTVTILDLPSELIEHICGCDTMNMIDIFNLAMSHPKLNDCLFRERNSYLWKSKYIQKYYAYFYFYICILFYVQHLSGHLFATSVHVYIFTPTYIEFLMR